MYVKKIYISKEVPDSNQKFRREDLIDVEDNLSDDFYHVYRKKCDIMDNFSFINDMYWMIERASERLFDEDSIGSFREYNRRLLSFLNTVYFFKEFVNNFGKNNTAIQKVIDDYRDKKKAFRFLLELRNCFMHHSVFNRGRTDEGQWVISVEELKRAEQDNIAHKKSHSNNKKKSNTGNEKTKLLLLLEYFESQYIEWEHDYYIDIHRMISDAKNDIQAFQSEIIVIIYNEFIKDLLLWMLNNIYNDENGYWYTLIVEDDQDDGDCFEPNYYLELYIDNLKEIYGVDSDVFNSCLSILETNGYDYLFEKSCSLEEYKETIFA